MLAAALLNKPSTALRDSLAAPTEMEVIEQLSLQVENGG
jgi:hypothetical protein